MGTHQVKEVGGATSNDPNRSQLAFYLKASVSNGLLVGEILSLKLRHLWARIGSMEWDVALSGNFHDPSSSQQSLSSRLVSLDKEILSLRRRHLWARIGSKKCDVAHSGDSHDLSRFQRSLFSRLISLVSA